MQYTDVYNLKKPDLSDLPTIRDINENMEAIEEALPSYIKVLYGETVPTSRIPGKYYLISLDETNTNYRVEDSDGNTVHSETNGDLVLTDMGSLNQALADVVSHQITYTPFCVNNGSIDSNGDENLLYADSSTVGSSLLKFRGGITGTSASGKAFTLNSIAPRDVTGLNGDLNVFVSEVGLVEFLGEVYNQRVEPTNVNEFDIWLNNLEPMSAKVRINNTWVNYEGVPVGSISVVNGVIQSVYTNPYNQNGYSVNTYSVATPTTFGVIRTTSFVDEQNSTCSDGAITPSSFYNLSNFRKANRSYSVNDIVGVPYHANLILKCVKAGTTSSNSLNTTGHLYTNQQITDGSVTWQVLDMLTVGANDENAVHKTGNETINGIKTFTDRIITNKYLEYKDIKNDWSDTSLNVWCDAGHVAWFDKTNNRRMHELVGAQNGVWRKACYINENQYFSVDSNRNISLDATVSFNGNVYAYNNIFHKNNNMDITTKPSKTLYTNYTFKDKNDKTLSFIQYAHSSDGTNSLGCFLQDNENNLYGVRVNTLKQFLPFGDNTYSLGSSSMRWGNVYATTFNGNLKGNADTATQASYSNQLQAFTGDDFTGGNHFVKAIRNSSNWSTRLWMCYNGGEKTSNEISVAYADTAGSAGNGIDSSGVNYVKFKDGTQICWGSNKGGDRITFANAFTSIPSIAFGYNIGSDNDRVIHGQAKYSSSTSFTMEVWDFNSNGWVHDRRVEWIAIGRWK